MSAVRFGTDGWRGVIADDFTFDGVLVVSRAIGRYLLDHGMGGREVLVARDARFLGDAFSRLCAGELSSMGLEPVLLEGVSATPACAHAIVSRRAAGAVMFTASHNPPHYQGMKFIPHYGGPAFSEITSEIERNIADLLVSEPRPKRRPFEGEEVDLSQAYLDHVRSLVGDLGRLDGVRVAYDGMHGSGGRYVKPLLQSLGVDFVCLRERPDPTFGGVSPEPKAETLRDLISLCERDGYLGLATDGDADRFGVVDIGGVFFPANRVLALLYWYLLREGKRGGVARTVSTTHMLDAIASRRSQRCFETPVGFKHLAKLMLAEDVLLAGEESGGMSVKGHVPEKDGVLACLLVVKMVSSTGMSLSALWEELVEELGFQLYSRRRDVECSSEEKARILARMEGEDLSSRFGLPVSKELRVDGLKLVFEDGSWVLIRPSGTEDMVRIYAEAFSPSQVDQLIARAEGLLEV